MAENARNIHSSQQVFQEKSIGRHQRQTIGLEVFINHCEIENMSEFTPSVMPCFVCFDTFPLSNSARPLACLGLRWSRLPISAFHVLLACRRKQKKLPFQMFCYATTVNSTACSGEPLNFVTPPKSRRFLHNTHGICAGAASDSPESP